MKKIRIVWLTTTILALASTSAGAAEMTAANPEAFTALGNVPAEALTAAELDEIQGKVVGVDDVLVGFLVGILSGLVTEAIWDEMNKQS